MLSSTTRFLANLTIVYAVWGSMYLAIGLLVNEAPPILSMGIRYAIAGAVLLIIIAARARQSLVFTRRQLATAAGLGVLMLALSNGLISLSQHVGMPSGMVALLVALVPLWVILLNTSQGRRPGPLGIAGIFVGLVGMTILVLGDLGGTGRQATPIGVGMVLLSGMVWAVGSWIQPRLPRPRDILAGAAAQMVAAGIALTVLGLLLGERIPRNLSAVAWGAWLYLIVVGSMVGFTAFVWLLNHGYVTQASTQAYVSPVIAVTLGWLVLGETVTVWVLVGGGTVLLSVVAVLASEGRRSSGVGPKTEEIEPSPLGELPD